jgi:hypothetical protein
MVLAIVLAPVLAPVLAFVQRYSSFDLSRDLMSFRRRPTGPVPGGFALALLLLGASGCDDGNPLSRLFGRDATVSRWAADSVLLATEPEVLFRVTPDPGGALVVPIATVGPQGVRTLSLSARGWLRVDQTSLQAGNMLTPYRNGEARPPIRMFRGMWQPGASPLDSLRCPVVIPMGRALVTGSEDGGALPPFATNGQRPPLKFRNTLDQAGINAALANIGTLVAPSSGIAPGQLPRYTRTVHQVPTGTNGSSTLVVEYNDPAPLPDSLAAFGERPRQLIVVLDKGNYGFRPTYSFSTVGGKGTPPKLEFLDYMDVDDDGIPELLFGLLERERAPLYTLVLRFENDAWREVYRFFGNRCVF